MLTIENGISWAPLIAICVFTLRQQDYYLRHGLSRSKNMGAARCERLEYDERDHRPPLAAQQRPDRDRDRAGRVGVEARMWLSPDCPLLATLRSRRSR